MTNIISLQYELTPAGNDFLFLWGFSDVSNKLFHNDYDFQCFLNKFIIKARYKGSIMWEASCNEPAQSR